MAIIKMAEKYKEDCKKVEEMVTTNNEWINSKDWRNDEFRISNKTYKMHIRVYEDTKYENKKQIPYKWEVSYWLWPTFGDAKTIASIDRKVFFDKEKAYKYIEGRKKYFSRYFKELYQPIRVEDVECFKSCGKLIRNYKIEGEEV